MLVKEQNLSNSNVINLKNNIVDKKKTKLRLLKCLLLLKLYL